MKVREYSICLVAVLFISIIIIVVPARSADFNKAYQADVSEKEAIFTFPVNPQKQYEWCPGGLQYAWNVKAKNGNEAYEFGFSLFTAMGASDCGKGDFAALLKEGQFSIWRVKKDGSAVDLGFKVDHAVNSNGRFLSIILKDKEAVRRIFSKKPKHVVFYSQVLEKQTLKKVPVVYTQR